VSNAVRELRHAPGIGLTAKLLEAPTNRVPDSSSGGGELEASTGGNSPAGAIQVEDCASGSNLLESTTPSTRAIEAGTRITRITRIVFTTAQLSVAMLRVQEQAAFVQLDLCSAGAAH